MDTMLMSLFVALTLVPQNDVNDSNDQTVQSFADRLKASQEQKNLPLLRKMMKHKLKKCIQLDHFKCA